MEQPPAAKFDLGGDDTPTAADADAAAGALSTISLDAAPVDDDGALAAAESAPSPFSQDLAGAAIVDAAVESSLPLSATLSSSFARGSSPQLLSSAAGTADPQQTSVTAPAAAAAPEAAAAGAAGAAAGVGAALAKASRMRVLVTDAEKVASKRLGLPASHICCLVRTECSLASPGGDTSSSSTFEVRRRFDDFEALSRVLKKNFRGYFVPRLPASDWLSGGDTFLKTRKVELQDYLTQVTTHPVLQGSEELLLFLSEPDLAACSRWQRMLQRPAPMDALLGRTDASSSTDSSTPAAAGQGCDGVSSVSSSSGWGMMNRMKHSIMSVVQSKAQPELSAEEQQLRQAKHRLKELQQHLSVCGDVVQQLLNNANALNEDNAELGRALSHFARFEESRAAREGHYSAAGAASLQLGADLQRLGYGALRQHSLGQQFLLSAGASLVVLPDYHALVPECVAALQEREDALAAVNVLAEQLAERQEAAAKMAAALGPAADTDKRMVQQRAATHALQDRLLAAEQQYQSLKQRNQAELDRLNLQQADDFRRALRRFAALQAQAAAAAADVWKGVAEQFDGDGGGDGGDGAAV